MRRLPLILLIAVLLAALCEAEESCPWMNAATAGGVLGGAVGKPTIKKGKSSDDATCEFLRQQGAIVSTLRIEVITMTAPRIEFASYTAQCGSGGTPLKAIGNEAVACGAAAKAGELAEQAVGRVRNQAFLIRIGSNDGAATRDTLREKARKVAEQVAGNMF
jgi:hypothetical protein